MAKRKERILVITLGLGGHTGYFEATDFGGARCKSHVTGYHSEPDTCITDMAERYRVDGAWVIDMREALRHNPMLCIRGPLLDVDLQKPAPFDAEGALDSPIGQGLLFMSGTFGHMLAGAAAGVVNLGQVGIDDYVNYWRSGGARIGRVKKSAIQWEAANGK